MTGFILGVCVGAMLAFVGLAFFGLVTTTTPDRAARNPRDWPWRA